LGRLFPTNSIVILLLFLAPIQSSAQQMALKTNLLYDVLLTPSLGGEIKLGKNWTASLMCTYNPIKYGDHKWKNFSFQPEGRYWFHRAFTGPFVGVNFLWGGFNIDRMHIGGLYGKHRQGPIVGGGITVGYQHILSDRWSMEFVLGWDYVHATYDQYWEGDNPYKDGRFTADLFLPIGTGITMVYMIK